MHLTICRRNVWLWGVISLSSKEIDKFNISGGECGLLSCGLDFTNFRLWDKICEQELHDLILSQYVVDDSHNTLIVDNAQQELLLHYKWN